MVLKDNLYTVLTERSFVIHSYYAGVCISCATTNLSWYKIWLPEIISSNFLKKQGYKYLFRGWSPVLPCSHLPTAWAAFPFALLEPRNQEPYKGDRGPSISVLHAGQQAGCSVSCFRPNLKLEGALLINFDNLVTF